MSSTQKTKRVEVNTVGNNLWQNTYPLHFSQFGVRSRAKIFDLVLMQLVFLLEIHYLIAGLFVQAVVWATLGGDKAMNGETELRPMPLGGRRMGNMPWLLLAVVLQETGDENGLVNWTGLDVVELVEDLLNSSMVKLVLGEGVLLFGRVWKKVVKRPDGELEPLEVVE